MASLRTRETVPQSFACSALRPLEAKHEIAAVGSPQTDMAVFKKPA
jgi:hypothetical protein